ncbi:MAG: LacI family DNA-binding transcriptional regulator [Georgenia sp.]
MSERRPRRTISGAVTLSDVAREAGVSLATASRAINGSASRAVRPELRERVIAASARLGYAPDANAQAVARGHTQAVGLVVHDIADPYFSTIAAGVTQEADRHGLAVMLANTQHDAERELGLVRALHNQRVRAILLAGGRQETGPSAEQLHEALATYQRDGGSVAMVGSAGLDVATVDADNAGGARALARELHARGYRRFAVLAGPTGQVTARERAGAFHEQLAEMGIAVPADAVVVSAFTRDGGYVGMQQLLAQAYPVEVVFAVSDVMAIGALAAARDGGVRIPRDLALAGFDDIATLRDITPGLTTVRLPMEEIGRTMTALALAPAGDTPPHTAVASTVVVRETTPHLC